MLSCNSFIFLLLVTDVMCSFPIPTSGKFNSKNVEVGAYEIPLSRNKKTQLVDALNNM